MWCVYVRDTFHALTLLLYSSVRPRNWEFDAIIIGGGIVGLATAAAASKKFDNVLLLEKNRTIVMETSSRNSEVIHAGLYYSGMPIKNQLCIRGRFLLEEYCLSNNVNFSKIGKYIFSRESSDKLDILYDLWRSTYLRSREFTRISK